jgi:hypothetical protein
LINQKIEVLRSLNWLICLFFLQALYKYAA